VHVERDLQQIQPYSTCMHELANYFSIRSIV
jgi:hypothetical protein